jgi:deoxyhypusine synthase
MPGHQYTPADYALQQKVESFGRLLFKLEEHNITRIYAVVLLFCQYENFDYLVLRFLNTCALLFEEFSQEWLCEGEV